MRQAQGLYSKFLLDMPLLLNGKEAIRELYNYPAEKIAVIHETFFNDFALFKMTFRKKELKFFKRSWLGEPDLPGLRETLSEIEEFKPDCFMAIGGGSVIDGTKLCRLFYEMPYYSLNQKLDGSLLRSGFIAIPTTVGSGAEVSSAAIYLENGHKEMIVNSALRPSIVVYDSRYVETAPKRIICSSALDALGHLIEGYVSNVENELADILAEKGLSLLKEELENYLKDEEFDYTRLQYAGYLGGIVQNHCIVGAAHGVAHQLAPYGFMHGEAIALLLPVVIEMNSTDKKTSEAYQKICKVSGFKATDELIRVINDVCDKAGISEKKKTLRKLLLEKENDEVFMNNIRCDRGGKGNPLEMNDEYLRTLFRKV